MSLRLISISRVSPPVILFARSGSSMDVIEQELDRLRSPDPGPMDSYVLTLQDRHRSKLIWDLDMEPPKDFEKVSFRRVETELRNLQAPCEEIMVYVREMTVTLQDVEVILGLPVEGEAVTESTDLKDIEQLCMRLLGKAPSKNNNDLQGQKVTMKWLGQFDGQIEEGDGEEVIKQKARGFLLRMLGGTIFADHTGTLVNLCWLPLLEDFEKAGRYSWGSGTLAALYNGLCHVATKGKEATGAMILLQIWAWERLPMLSPARLGKRSPHPGAPLVGKWYDMFTAPDLAQSVVGHYRHALDIMRADEVEWMPYKPEVLDALPPYCHAGMAIWRASVPLICFSYVEMHQPERVMRQFGFRQHVPPPSNAIHPSHGYTLRNGQKGWGEFHRLLVQQWEGRMAKVVAEGEPDLADHEYPSNDPYVLWYEQITRRYISRNGAATASAMRCFGFLNKQHVQPLTPQQYGEVGRIALLHLAKLSKHVRKQPPVHRRHVLPVEPILENPVIDEVQRELDQFGVEEQQQQQQQQQQQDELPRENEELPVASLHEVRTHDHTDNPIYTPDLHFSPSMLSHLLSTTTETTAHDWDDLDVEGVGDPFDDTQLQLNRKRARHSSLGDHGDGGMGEVTQVGPHVEGVVDMQGHGDVKGDMDMGDYDVDEIGPHEGGGIGEVGQVTQDGTPPGPRRTKRQHKGPRGCGTDHGKGKKDDNDKKGGEREGEGRG
ncbi:hypothetical protein Vadar_007634 [Vaccinium darrowii]|uniref:Uncharacterized protein n=1 Tax=Vaccinium darrowii TaxID=229202 RepID=A0ACB7XNW9_9ERIC|nr:hypothetical protein Vadar_007634 [Vaccinium darrowii]